MRVQDEEEEEEGATTTQCGAPNTLNYTLSFYPFPLGQVAPHTILYVGVSVSATRPVGATSSIVI
ncbi:hypothetical protein Csa_000127 [Cucumis sativus]|uniref:Uncharacterized protein n=1 Tax=Cucumis sativus TaxID=3659 RepID=A0A0A0KQT1_CUCSA|nr:hypothetical protein Csa_000127 [Cucumis sativus]